MNEELLTRAKEAFKQALEGGMDVEDAQWMAQGALIRYGREHGSIDELSPEMAAAIEQVVKRILVEHQSSL